MNKKEFIAVISEKSNFTTKDAEIAPQAVTDSLTELQKILIPGLGNFPKVFSILI